MSLAVAFMLTIEAGIAAEEAWARAVVPLADRVISALLYKTPPSKVRLEPKELPFPHGEVLKAAAHLAPKIRRPPNPAALSMHLSRVHERDHGGEPEADEADFFGWLLRLRSLAVPSKEVPGLVRELKRLSSLHAKGALQIALLQATYAEDIWGRSRGRRILESQMNEAEIPYHG